MRTRGLIAFGGPIAVLSFSAWGDRRFVPAGLPLRSAEPLYLWYGELGTFPWPEATNAVQVVVNDAGAILPPPLRFRNRKTSARHRSLKRATRMMETSESLW